MTRMTLVAPGDPDSLALAVERIIEHPGVAAEMAATGPRSVLEGYRVERQRADRAELHSTRFSSESSGRGFAT